MKRGLSNKLYIAAFVLPTVIFFSCIVVIPIFVSFYYSTLDWTAKTRPSLDVFIGLRNYVSMFTKNRTYFTEAAIHSLLYAAVSVFIQLPFSLFIALLLSGGVKGENVYRNAFFIPVIISSVVIGQLWLKIFNNDYGLLNMALRALNLPTPKGGWLGNSDTMLLTTFIPTLWQYVGYHMLLMYGALRSISPDIIEAAKVDGATGARLAFRIQIPLIKPMLKVCLSFSLIGSFKMFDMPYVLYNAKVNKHVAFPAFTMYYEMFSRKNYGIASAEAMFIVAECLLFTLLLNFLFRERKEKLEKGMTNQ